MNMKRKLLILFISFFYVFTLSSCEKKEYSTSELEELVSKAIFAYGNEVKDFSYEELESQREDILRKYAKKYALPLGKKIMVRGKYGGSYEYKNNKILYLKSGKSDQDTIPGINFILKDEVKEMFISDNETIVIKGILTEDVVIEPDSIYEIKNCEIVSPKIVPYKYECNIPELVSKCSDENYDDSEEYIYGIVTRIIDLRRMNEKAIYKKFGYDYEFNIDLYKSKYLIYLSDSGDENDIKWVYWILDDDLQVKVGNKVCVKSRLKIHDGMPYTYGNDGKYYYVYK